MSAPYTGQDAYHTHVRCEDGDVPQHANELSFADGGTNQEDEQRARSTYSWMATRAALGEGDVVAAASRPPLRIRRDNRLRQGHRRADGRPAIHWNTSCAGCGRGPIVGTRYTSAVLPHHHMCSRCAERVGHVFPVDVSDFAPGENVQLATTVMFSDMSSPLVRTDIGPFGATNLGRTQAPSTVYGYGAGGPPLYSSA